ncbi:MAG TPA: DUF6765 family protein [Polyangiaceae bacterium]|nr:DUF6765 family protein [Polyangiaceae bacterium]
MQIDFHHAVTYVLARLAGFDDRDAGVIGYAAQYVDDATNSGEISFVNGARYSRISSAHKMLDYRNFRTLANARVWVPFHFLPGNGGKPAGADPEGSFIRKLVCRPNSPVAVEMVERAVSAHGEPCALHRLGITMHVYADTWAHQGFAGVSHPINTVRDLSDGDGKLDLTFRDRVRDYFGDLHDLLANEAADGLMLGHGAALSHPDKPFLRWSYTNGLKEKVVRDNPADFVQAALHLFDAMRMFRVTAGRPTPNGMAPADRDLIERNIREFQETEGEERHARWLECIAAGEFSFGRARLSYVAKGEGSWKFSALGTTEDKQTREDGYEFTPAFLRSDWKLFHDALQAHRLAVLHDILPRYGICAA